VSVDNTAATATVDKVPVTDGTDGYLLKFINSSATGSASTTEEGLVEIATNAEVLA